MPKIAELKMIEGAMWARLDVNWKIDEPVSLLTEPELQAIKKGERAMCAEIADDVAARYLKGSAVSSMAEDNWGSVGASAAAKAIRDYR